MKDETKNIKRKIQDETGAMIVEAAIVFPVMFFVLFFIIFIGNMYYEQAKVDDIVLKNAVKGAQLVADPIQAYMESNNGSLPADITQMPDIEPYRYILGSLSDTGSIAQIENKISQNVIDEINDTSLIFFDNSKANVLGTDNEKIAHFKTYVVYSTFVVQVNYEIKFPFRFLGNENATIFKLSSRAEATVNDAPEFIRNVDMAVDLFEGTAAGNTIKGVFNKMNDFIRKITGE